MINEFIEMFYTYYDTYGAGDISFLDYSTENIITMDCIDDIITGSETIQRNPVSETIIFQLIKRHWD